VFGEAPGAVAWTDLVTSAAEAPVAARTRGDVACIVYSSGTGGAPKGCLLPHGAYLAQYEALAATFDWRRGDRYFSVLPTNHAIDFLCGFVAAWATGATVIHQRTLRPEHLVATMRRYRVTQMAVVPLILQAFERALDERIDAAPPELRRLLAGLTAVHRRLTERAPNPTLARWMLKPIHDAFGGHLRILYCGGAFTDRRLAERFAHLGIPVAIGYGLTEACTVATVNDLRPFRGDTVGAAVPGVRVRIADPGPDGVGEVQIAGPTLFRGYLDDPEQTASAFDGPWLRTGDLGWIDGAHHLHLVGRRKNMIVTAGGKNVYPEDVESAFADVPADDLAVLAADYVWPRGELRGEALLVVVRTADRASARSAVVARNRTLPEHKRCGLLLWTDREFPRTASWKVKRADLAARLRADHPRDSAEALT
jgi:long-chain acyl-CoA synthetase